jgi:hypothetical protein
MKFSYTQFYTSNGKPVYVTKYADTEQQLIDKLLAFRLEKKIKPDSYEEVSLEVKSKIKSSGSAIKIDKQVKPKTNKLTLQQAVLGAKALVEIIKGDIVDDAELNRRASICAHCELINDTAGGCTSCARKGLVKLARNLAINYGRNFTVPKITAYKLRPVKSASLSEFYCGHCGCSCLNLALSKSKNFVSKENNETRPDHCWAKVNGKNWKS